MPARISLDLRTTIRTLFYHAHKKRAEIAKELNLSWKVVDHWVKADSIYDKPRNIKPLSDREERAVKRNIVRGESIKGEANRVERSVSFIRKRVRKSKDNKRGYFPYKSLWQITLSQNDKNRRVLFANSFPYDQPTLMIQELQLKYWYDEKKWLLGKPPNKQNRRYYRPSPRPKGVGIFPKFSSDTIINCCVGICWYGKSSIRWYVDKVPYKSGLYVSLFMFILIAIQMFECNQSSRTPPCFSGFHLKNSHSQH